MQTMHLHSLDRHWLERFAAPVMLGLDAKLPVASTRFAVLVSDAPGGERRRKEHSAYANLDINIVSTKKTWNMRIVGGGHDV